MSNEKKLCPKLDDLTISSNKKDIFSFGRPPKAIIDKLVMKPPRVLPCQYLPDTLAQKRKLTDDDDDDDDDEYYVLSETELLDSLSTLQVLEKKEQELKIAILYEKLKQEEHVPDQSLTQENIHQLQQKLKETEENLRLRQVSSSKKQQFEILYSIAQPPNLKNKSKEELFEYSYDARRFILYLMSERKQKEKEIDLLQKQIKEAEEKVLQLKTKIDDYVSTPPKYKMDTSAEKELKCLKEENNKRSCRIQLLSNITKTLIDNISTQDNSKDDLKLLALSCENILTCNFEDLDELTEICKMVYSTKI